jgi:hypothetical protein
MGLLRKAARAVPVDDTTASPALKLQSGPAGAGLLRRSLQILSLGRDAHGLRVPSPAAAQPKLQRAETRSAKESLPAAFISVEDAARKITEEAKTLSGVELPSLLFTMLRRRLSILKGAFLLYDPVRLEYAPWASHGFDQTTLHRMRIPSGANVIVTALAKGQSLELTEAGQKSGFQRFFSSREFSTLERILLTPFIVEESLAGVLLVAGIRHPFADTAQLLSCLGRVSTEVAPLLQKARGFLLRWSQAKVARPPVAPEEQVARLLVSPASGEKTFLFLSVGLDAYVKGIAAANEDMDPFRLREDIRSFLDAFLADLGVAVMLPGGALLVCLQAIRREDSDLFMHQLRSFLGQHFFGNTSDIKAVKSRTWPGDGTDVRELIAFFSS